MNVYHQMNFPQYQFHKCLNCGKHSKKSIIGLLLETILGKILLAFCFFMILFYEA